MMNQAYFIFNNISSEDYLMVNKLPPIIKASKNIDKIEIQGRDGFLTRDFETYKATVKPVECTIINLDDIDYICSWLDGNGEVIFSNEPDKIYKATIINQIEFRKIAMEVHTLLIQFECQPHKYSIDNNLITLTTSQIIYNNGSCVSKPVIKLYGSGNVNLSINNKVINLKNISEYITIDSNLQDCYKDLVYRNSDMSGEFPEFLKGNNIISWTGTVTKIEIIPNWRWL